MANKYDPKGLKEDALKFKWLLDTAVDVQSVLQLLISKNIITQDELNNMRDIVRNFPKYKESYAVVMKMIEASNLYDNDPQAYLKALLDEKLRDKN